MCLKEERKGEEHCYIYLKNYSADRYALKYPVTLSGCGIKPSKKRTM